MANLILPPSPRVFNLTPADALLRYRKLADELRQYAINLHGCPRDAQNARNLAHTYDRLADACEAKAVQQ